MLLKKLLKTALLWALLFSPAFAQVGPGGYTPRSGWTFSSQGTFTSPPNNVGIGSQEPSAQLDVNGTIRTTNLTITSVTGGPSCLTATNGVVTGTGSACGSGGGGSGTPGGSQFDVQFFDVNGTVNRFFGNSGLVYTGVGATAGNVGIGSVSPGQILDTQGTGRFSGSVIVGKGAATITGDANGNVGIGSASPGYGLDVQGSVRSLGYYTANSAAFGPNAVLGSSSSTLSNLPTNLDVEHNFSFLSGTQIEQGLGTVFNPAADTTGHLWDIWSELRTGGASNFNGEVISIFGEFDHYGTGNVTNNAVGIGGESHNRTGAVTGAGLLVGVRGLAANDGTGTVSSMDAVQAQILNEGSTGVVTQYILFDGEGVIPSGGSNVFNKAIGLYIAPLTAAQDYAIYTNENNGYTQYHQGGAPSYFSGNIGLGTLVPNGVLDVEGTLYNTILNGLGTAVNNVGIGTFLPGQILDVQGTVRTTGFTLTGNGAATGFILQSKNGLGIGSWVPEPTGGAGTPGGTQPQIQVNSNGSFAGGTNTGIDANGNVGIGTWSNLTTLLDVQGTLQSAYVATNGNVGVGTIVPGAALQVVGNGFNTFSSNIGINSLNPGVALDVQGTIRGTGFALPGGAQGQVVMQNGVGIGTWSTIASGGSGANPGGSATNLQYQVNGTTFGGVTGSAVTGGNVGIGSLNPGNTLDVGGTVRTTNFTMSSGANSGFIMMSNGVGVGTWVNASSVSTITSFANPGNNITLSTQNGTATTAMRSDGAPALSQSITPTWTGQHIFNGSPYAFTTGNVNNNVGIGSANPGNTLDVLGTVRSNQMVDSGVTVSKIVVTDTNHQFTAASNVQDLAYCQSNGTNCPAAGANYWLQGQGGVGVSTVWPGGVGIGTIFTNNGALVVLQGNVGIGTWGPQLQLDVKGTAQMTGFILNSNPVAGDILMGTSIGLGTWVPASSVLGASSVQSVTASAPLQSSGGVNPSITVVANPFIQGSVGLGTSTINGTGLTVNGTITGNGNVGIATTIINGTGLIVNGTITGNGNVGIATTIINGTGLTINGGMDVEGTNGVFAIFGNTSPVSVGSPLPVGIGTGSPGGKLDVEGTVNGTIMNGLRNANGNVGIGTFIPQGALIVFGGNVGIGTWVPLQLLDVRGTLTEVVIMQNGNVGIGTIAPTANLQISSSLSTNVGIGTTVFFNTLETVGNMSLGAAGTESQAVDANGAYFGGNVGIGTWKMPGGVLITKSGNVGISSDSPGQLLDTNGTVRITGGTGQFIAPGEVLSVQGTIQPNWGSSGLTSSVPILEVQGTVTPFYNLTVTSNGNVGIGSLTPGVAMDIQGTTRIPGLKATTGYRYLCISSTGVLESQSVGCVGT